MISSDSTLPLLKCQNDKKGTVEKTESQGHSSWQLEGAPWEMYRISGDAPLRKEGHASANEAGFGCEEQGTAHEELVSSPQLQCYYRHKPQSPLSVYIKKL